MAMINLEIMQGNYIVKFASDIPINFPNNVMCFMECHMIRVTKLYDWYDKSTA